MRERVASGDDGIGVPITQFDILLLVEVADDGPLARVEGVEVRARQPIRRAKEERDSEEAEAESVEGRAVRRPVGERGGGHAPHVGGNKKGAVVDQQERPSRAERLVFRSIPHST